MKRVQNQSHGTFDFICQNELFWAHFQAEQFSFLCLFHMHIHYLLLSLYFHLQNLISLSLPAFTSLPASCFLCYVKMRDSKRNKMENQQEVPNENNWVKKKQNRTETEAGSLRRGFCVILDYSLHSVKSVSLDYKVRASQFCGANTSLLPLGDLWDIYQS